MDPVNMDSRTGDIQSNIVWELMKQRINNGWPFQCTDDGLVEQRKNAEGALLNVEHEQDENERISMPIVYKKRARVKFTQQQLDVLEATFQQHRYPTIDMVDGLVEQLNLPTQKITVWFQNRRARLKRSQQRSDDQQMFEKDDQQQCDSGILLDEDVSRASSTSPPSNLFINVPSTMSYIPSAVAPVLASSYYLPNHSYSPFYNSMWPHFGYTYEIPSFRSAVPYSGHLSYDTANYGSPFVFQDMNNIQHQSDLNG